MEITETGELMGRGLIQQIELDEYEVGDLLNGEEVSQKIYSGGAMEEEDLQRVIEIRSEDADTSHDDLLYEISNLENKTFWGEQESQIDVYDDVMEALFELIAALWEMNERIGNGHNPIIVYHDVLKSYNIQKAMDTYNYYESIRDNYR